MKKLQVLLGHHRTVHKHNWLIEIEQYKIELPVKNSPSFTHAVAYSSYYY